MLTISQRHPRNTYLPWAIGLTLLGLLVTLTALQFWTLETRWAVTGTLLILMPFVLAVVPNTRRFLLAALVLSIPLNADYNLFFQTGLISGARGLVISMTDVLLLVALVLWMIEMAQSKRDGAVRFFPRISWPTLGLILMMAVSMLAAQNLLWSVFDILAFIKVFLFFFYMANNIRDRKDVRLVMQLLFLGVIVETVLSIWQINEWPGLSFLRWFGATGETTTAIKMDIFSTTRPGGTLVSCNNLARFFGFILPMAYMVALRGETAGERWFARVASVIGTVGIIYTLSRSTWIALVPSVALLFPLMLSRRLVTWRIMRNLAFMMIVTTVIVVTFRELIYDRIVSYDLGSGQTRVTSAMAAWRMIKEHPVIGVGINNYGNNAKYHYDAEEPRSKYWIVHNSFLLYMAEIGLIGFIFYLWFVMAGFSSCRRALHNSSSYLSAVAIGVLGGWIGFVISAMADKGYKDFYPLLLTMWALVAITEAINRLGEEYDQKALNMLAEKSYLHEL
jgi:putative inorganic carbon (hco3(-)) transporter